MVKLIEAKVLESASHLVHMKTCMTIGNIPVEEDEKEKQTQPESEERMFLAEDTKGQYYTHSHELPFAVPYQRLFVQKGESSCNTDECEASFSSVIFRSADVFMHLTIPSDVTPSFVEVRLMNEEEVVAQINYDDNALYHFTTLDEISWIVSDVEEHTEPEMFWHGVGKEFVAHLEVDFTIVSIAETSVRLVLVVPDAALLKNKWDLCVEEPEGLKNPFLVTAYAHKNGVYDVRLYESGRQYHIRLASPSSAKVRWVTIGAQRTLRSLNVSSKDKLLRSSDAQSRVLHFIDRQLRHVQLPGTRTVEDCIRVELEAPVVNLSCHCFSNGRVEVLFGERLNAIDYASRKWDRFQRAIRSSE